MLYPSLFLLASAGAAIAQLPAGCESLTNATELLQADDGKAYCTSILSLQTVTNTVVESMTALETTTIVIPSEITETETTTQTDTISSGTATETAPLFWVTETATVSTTEYSCSTEVFRRGLNAYAAGQTSSAPEPTSITDKDTLDKCEDEDSRISPSEYGDYSPGYITVYPPSAPQGQVLTLIYSSHSPVLSNAQYSKTDGATPAVFSSSATSSSHSYSASVSNRPRIPSNSTIYFTGGVTASSKIQVPHISRNSTTIPTGGPTASSVVLTTSPLITPTPAPKPSCETAPIALRTGFACDAVSAACGCLGLAQATEDVTSTTTFHEAIFITNTMLITTTTTLTEIEFVTVPAATTVESPSSTLTTTTIATATICPCSNPTSSLCGKTPDTCKDLQSDTSNCGSCGNTCSDGQTCNAGECKTPAVPNTLKCVASSCSNYIRCGTNSNCICAATPEGTGVCVYGTTSCSNPACTASADCEGDMVCAVKTCCRGGAGVCVLPQNICPNTSSAGMMFRRKSWDGETVGGGM